ncbi:MAG: hypothetical protein B1H03_03785 [Planctomycetales bacterium 4484_113]|nr:MAG: hypothetical protein B1H03_03785 [Planctomycetales bacterium 4484_113]
MRAAITGVSSMLGFNLARKLLHEGSWEVNGLTRDPRVRTVSHLRRLPGFHLHTGDVARSSVDELLKGADVVFHLAAISSERLCRLRPEAAYAINAGGTALVAERAGKKGIRMVFSSSCAVYADSFYPDEGSPLTRRNLYGLTKLAGERAIAVIGQQHKLAYAVVRFTRLFGAGMTRNPIFDLMKAENGGRATLYEGLESCYDFLYAGDAADLLLDAALNETWHGRTVNAGNGEGMMLKDLVAVVEHHLGKSIDITVAQPQARFDVPRVDLMKALGFMPRYGLANALIDMQTVAEECGLSNSPACSH